MSKEELITEKNIESSIMKAISTYFDNHKMVDAMVWRHMILELITKYKIKDEFNKALKEQRKK